MVFRWLTRWLSKPGTKRANLYNYFWFRISGQFKVGVDHLGNEYYLYQPVPDTPIRRFCKFNGGMLNVDNLPFLWYQWIRYQRVHPPTQEELEEYERYLRQIKERAAIVKKAEDELYEKDKEYVEHMKNKDSERRARAIQRLHQETIDMFAARDRATRLAAEALVERQRAHIDQQERDFLADQERQKKELKKIWDKPKMIRAGELPQRELDQDLPPAPDARFKEAEKAMKEARYQADVEIEREMQSSKSQPFRPGTWRPYQKGDDSDDEDDEEELVGWNQPRKPSSDNPPSQGS